MSTKGTLTNEKLTKRFDNPFSLVNYAISLAKMRIEKGEEFDANPVNEVLELIASNRNIENDSEAEEQAMVG